jgi:hypothetical protein
MQNQQFILATRLLSVCIFRLTNKQYKTKHFKKYKMFVLKYLPHPKTKYIVLSLTFSLSIVSLRSSASKLLWATSKWIEKAPNNRERRRGHGIIPRKNVAIGPLSICVTCSLLHFYMQTWRKWILAPQEIFYLARPEVGWLYDSPMNTWIIYHHP